MLSSKEINQNGQSLVELIIALVVAGIISVSLVRVVVISLNNVEFSRNKNFSLHLAQSKIEEIRKNRDSLDWEKFLEGCLDEEEKLDEIGNFDVDGRFSRKTTFLKDEGNQKVDVKIEVFWSDSKGQHSSIVNSTLTKWKQ